MDEGTRQKVEQIVGSGPLTPEALQVMTALAVERHYEQRTVRAWEWVKRLAALAAIAAFILAALIALF